MAEDNKRSEEEMLGGRFRQFGGHGSVDGSAVHESGEGHYGAHVGGGRWERSRHDGGEGKGVS
jgi:hypothetical protein